MNEKDINHLEWVFERMIYVHNENRNIDYMIRFKEIIEQLRQQPVMVRSEQLVCLDCVDGRDEFEPDWKCPDCRQKDDPNNMLEAGLSLIQAKDAAMREGKKIKHCSFMNDEYLYYKNGYWFTHHDCQLPDVCFLNEQEQGWWSDGWLVVS